ncbi:hypothetical protein OPV22_012331 [Ensete ventricosum]|uniref:Uncharacterized protein n=1 Tax=Ensete ventricosum TaxID=4639 RepID=A0AAV8R2X3_ENSVE|nr:hypothetical protein OPV22_012331 [Ensete ventricosum]
MCAARSGRHLSGNAKRESIGKLDAANRAEWAAPNRDPVVPYEVKDWIAGLIVAAACLVSDFTAVRIYCPASVCYDMSQFGTIIEVVGLH